LELFELSIMWECRASGSRSKDTQESALEEVL
jgi:hypothetical protein